MASRAAEQPWLNLAVTVLPLIGVFAIVVVSMTGGWATPTEFERARRGGDRPARGLSMAA